MLLGKRIVGDKQEMWADLMINDKDFIEKTLKLKYPLNDVEKQILKKKILNQEQTENNQIQENINQEKEKNISNLDKMDLNNTESKIKDLKENKIYKLVFPSDREVIVKLLEIKSYAYLCNTDYIFENIKGGDNLVHTGFLKDKNRFPIPSTLMNSLKIYEFKDKNLNQNSGFGLGF